MIKQFEFKRVLIGSVALLFITCAAAPALLGNRVYAAGQQITSRSLTLQAGTSDVNGDGINDGGSIPGATVTHDFNFTINNTSQNLGSISFQYCTTADAVTDGIGCDAPAGLDVTGATLATDGGDITGFTVKGTSTQCDNACPKPNVITIGLASATSVGSASALDKAFSGVINPTTKNQTFFVRIFTYSSTTGGVFDPTDGTVNDYGVVAASTTDGVILSGQMPESLVFCTGHTIDINVSGVPDCTTATAANISFNQLFSPSSTTWAYSQMAASTNATTGYVITVSGPTLTSGSNTITAIGGTADVSRIDTRQFGLNLIDDLNPTAPIVTDPTIGSASDNPITYYDGDSQGTGGNLNPATNGTDYTGKAAVNFDGAEDTTNNFPTYAFAAGTTNIVAKSDSTGTPGPTNTQRYTATYIVNVSGNLPAGTYKTTLTYICTPTY